MSKTRQYRSPKRERAKADTRDKIVHAVVRVVLDDGIHAFTVQNVALKAGVSHRTVYRHFTTREELLDGLAKWLSRIAAGSTIPTSPETIGDVIVTVAPSYLAMGELRDAVRAYVITSLALHWQDEARRQRTLAFDKSIGAAFPHLPSKERREAAALIRHLASTRAWYTLTVEGGLDDAAAARAADWAVRTLFKDLGRRNRAAAKAKARS
ncbi:MAG TPA: TetR/AcrR family transcriptional regulator [Vicinamibacteria bacterium]|nr:TetR/AcrR family transcriptional regulator [Gemmatimonadales bacterium]HSF17675.1 TetR/AcrR family transcriptional regulator [Vicinamibacteria bacterium]